MIHTKEVFSSVWSILFILAATSCFAAETLQQKMDTYIEAWTAEDLFSGAVLVAKDGEILFQDAYGKADYNKDIVNTVETRFRIASLTKGFTAMTVLQLEQKGLLRLNESLATYIPDYPRGNEITLEMLLNSRSGIVDHTELPDFNTRRRTDLCPLERTIETFKNLPLEFPPGTEFEYSNSNYILLGFIIEKVTQKPYADIVKSQILDPLSMNRSGFEYYQREIADMAMGYRLKGNSIVPAENRIMQNAHASGAIYSTVGDLYKWDRALYGDKLIDKTSVNKLITSGPEEYSYGWGKTRIFDKDVLAHMGDMEGFRPNIVRFINDDACIIVLSNFEHCPVTRISEDLAAILFGQPYRMPKKTLKDPEVASNYNEYVGRYQIKVGFILAITQEDGRLCCQATGQARLQLYPETATRFFLREVDASITFVKDANGRVTKLILRQNGKDFPAEKL